MNDDNRITRRTSLKGLGTMGAAAFVGGAASASIASTSGQPPEQATDVRRTIFAKVWKTPLVDTHEHLVEEHARLHPAGNDDWSMVLAGYLGSDMLTAGMPQADHHRFFEKGTSPGDKWKLLAPYWPAIKNTGYGQAARISIRQLYGVDELSAATVEKLQAGYEKLRQPGFYRHILCDLAGIESCQVNRWPFSESPQPALLMQDLCIVEMFCGSSLNSLGKASGIPVASLDDWHKVIDWWFAKYGRFAVAVKSQDAYRRDIDYRRVPAGEVAETYKKQLAQQPVAPQEQKALEDHLFWYAVDKATQARLPVKLHTGYYAGENGMPLARLMNNPASACELCRAAPATPFVFMHICYPYYEDIIAVAKQYTNAHLDMCWSWIINPVAAKDFLKKYLVTAPANKILTFGGDYFNVEQVLGHSIMARHGIALALNELVEEGWLTLPDALELIEPIMRGNARRIFHLDEKEKILRNVPWATS